MLIRKKCWNKLRVIKQNWVNPLLFTNHPTKIRRDVPEISKWTPDEQQSEKAQSPWKASQNHQRGSHSAIHIRISEKKGLSHLHPALGKHRCSESYEMYLQIGWKIMEATKLSIEAKRNQFPFAGLYKSRIRLWKLPYFPWMFPRVTLETPGFHITERTTALCDRLHWAVSLGHIWASFSKLNFITCQILQPLKNYSIPGLIYDIISKWLGSCELILSQNDAGCAPEGGVASRPPQPWATQRTWVWAQEQIHFLTWSGW